MDHGFPLALVSARSLGSRRRGVCEAVKRFGNRKHETVVVYKHARGADHEVAVLGDVQVIDHLGGAGLDRVDGREAAEHAEAIAGFQVARHGPALAGLPEAVDAGGDDRFAGE